MNDKLISLEHKLGYTYQSKDLLVRAITHRSAGATHNERLEFLGDAVLSFHISRLLWHRFPQAQEGELSRLRSRLVDEDALAGQPS